jgi:hypothetical protein
MTNPRLVLRPKSGISSQSRDVRARAWAYVFEVFNRCEEVEGGPAAAPSDAKRRHGERRTSGAP